MERNMMTLPVRVILFCGIYAINIAILITGIITGKLWLWIIALLISAMPIIYFKERNKRVWADYIQRRKQNRTKKSNNTVK